MNPQRPSDCIPSNPEDFYNKTEPDVYRGHMQMKQSNNKKNVFVMMYLGLFIFFIFFVFTFFIVAFGFRDQIEPADVIVVFGNTVNSDGLVSPRLQARLDKAVEIFRAEKGKFILVSGALGKEGVEESSAMKQYLLTKGISEDRVFQDSQGVTTRATAQHTKELLTQQNLSSTIVVSQFFHLARATLAFHQAGISGVGHVHANYYEWRDIYGVLRELVALPVYWAE